MSLYVKKPIANSRASTALSWRSRTGRERAKHVVDRAVDKDQIILISAELLKNSLLGGEELDREQVASLVDSVMKCANENSQLITSLF